MIEDDENLNKNEDKEMPDIDYGGTLGELMENNCGIPGLQKRGTWGTRIELRERRMGNGVWNPTLGKKREGWSTRIIDVWRKIKKV